jgi:ubiquinone biosynthesis O-methyltransferase
VSKLEEACWERIRRRREAIRDILDLLSPLVKTPMSDWDVLDLGCGLGALAIPTARWTRHVTGVDVNPEYIRHCRDEAAREGLKNVTFEEGSLFDMDETAYDVVLCSDVIEHVKDQKGVLAAVRRSLADDGAYYLSTNNRWWPYEGHFGLPFLSYLPKREADGYVRLMGRGTHCNIYPLSLRDLKKLLEEAGLEYHLVPPLNPRTLRYQIGTKLVSASPAFWHFANAFQVVGRKAR